jgi:putative Ca2+/H+ antiporter (TMEM165/GDT1 family)
METGAPSDELTEVEEELGTVDDLEGGSEKGHKAKSSADTMGVWWQTFTLTFLAEWGDRSQIATIALASAKDPYGVTVGGVLGHAMCSAVAVMGGRCAPI